MRYCVAAIGVLFSILIMLLILAVFILRVLTDSGDLLGPSSQVLQPPGCVVVGLPADSNRSWADDVRLHETGSGGESCGTGATLSMDHTGATTVFTPGA
jgi:hypothetical protein